MPQLPIINCSTALDNLYREFEGYHKSKGSGVTEIKGNEVELSSRIEDSWRCYSRKFKTNDGKWLTVQILQYNGFFTNRNELKVFGAKGKELVRSSGSNCLSTIWISGEGRNVEENLLILSAIRAVINTNFEVKIDPPQNTSGDCSCNPGARP